MQPLPKGEYPMKNQTIQSSEDIVSCSDHGGHPLVYINIKEGNKACQYCGQRFEYTPKLNAKKSQ